MTSLAPLPSTEIPESPARKEAHAYLQNLLCKTLLVHTTDHRMFRGNSSVPILTSM
ncbi:putative lsm domain protein [Botrytis fragariae]|uniref:Putative lsm domain protein n=1 Tax=Botrytis fragariae TaxID=1964551 RepID=A0A8H6AJ25_9HELO|nr:putative lsm domain protein [Botrytis fragariae]KAF5868302.1 putative lsm domain protein [Botrytis fragariae]